MEYLYEQGWGDEYEDALLEAVRNGQLSAVQWLLQHISKLAQLSDPNLMDEAAKYGQLAILRFFHNMDSSSASTSQHSLQNQTRQLNSGIDGAALHVIRGKGCSQQAMNFAASNGYLEVVQWLHTNRDEGCTAFAMDNAARHGHLDVLQWLHDNHFEGCTTQAMDFAAN